MTPAALETAMSIDLEREPYQPGGGLEGAVFMARFCDLCARDAAFRDGTGDSCPIVANTMVYDEDDAEYPVEWRQDGPEGPRCTAFQPARQALKQETQS